MQPKDIHVIYGSSPLTMTRTLLTSLRIESELKTDMLIGIKPNLVLSKAASSGATTHPEIAEGLIQHLQEKGFRRIIILEGSWVGASTVESFRAAGYEKLARQYGVPLHDLKTDAYEERQAGGMSIKICKTALKVDFLINLPVLKAHCQTELTCCLKNLKGCIPDSEKRRFHSMGLTKPIAHLGALLKPSLHIVDGIAGDLTFEEGGNPVQMDRLIAGKDPVLIDAYAASLLGYSPNDIAYIPLAEKLGAGCADLTQANLIEYDAEKKNQSTFQPSGLAKRLAVHAAPKDACSACYGSLIHALKRLDEKGRLRGIKEPIAIGQGYKKQTGSGIGIGSCANGFSCNVPGCPPTAKDIADALSRHLK